MNKVHANRLLKLADHLSELPRKLFDFGTYAEKRSCGTVGCAMGHACMMPAFKRLGAGLKEMPNDDVLWPTIGGVASPVTVGKELFGVGIDDYESLFMPHESGLGADATPKQVAKHIRKFVAERTQCST